MKKLFKIFTIVAVLALTSTACQSNDDFSEIVVASDLEAQSTQGSGDRETEVPGKDD